MNKTWLLQLSKQKKSHMKILYLSDYCQSQESSHKDQHNYHKEIFNALKNIGLSVYASSSVEDLILNNKKFDYVFTLLNRMNFNNSEVLISSLCEYYSLPYLGSTPNIRALAEDKHLSKIFFQQHNMPTAKWKLYRFSDPLSSPDFDGPYFIKWRYGASSRGVSCESISETWEEAKIELQKLHKEKRDAILESYLPGKSFTVPVIGAEKPVTLPVIETFSTKKGGIITYDQARGKELGMHREICRKKSTKNNLQMFATKLFMAIGNIDYFRVDYKCDANNQPNILEFNVCCNLKSTSAIIMASNDVGVSQGMLLEHILCYSINRQCRSL